MKDISLKRLKPGETFELEGKTYRVKKDSKITCKGCAFTHGDRLCLKSPKCHWSSPDEPSVIFVEVK